MSEVTTTPSAAHTQPLSANEIFRTLPPNYSISRPILDQYLSLMVDDPVSIHPQPACLPVKRSFLSSSSLVFPLI